MKFIYRLKFNYNYRFIIAFLLICMTLMSIILILTGCTQETSDYLTEETKGSETGDETSNHVTEEISNPSGTYNTQLVFIKKKGDNWLVVDEYGIVHEVQVSSVPDDIVPGSICQNGQVSETSPGKYQVVVDYPYSLSPARRNVIASGRDAAVEYAGFILDNFVYNGNPDYAISEYSVKKVEVKKIYNGGRIEAVMDFDVKPVKGAFAWGKPEADGFIRNRRFNFTIYGADDTWLSTDNFYSYLEQEGGFPTLSKTEYTPAENQNVIYEDDEWSYYGDRILLPQSKELQEANITEYIGIISRINHKSGTAEQLFEGDKNHSYWLFAEYGGKLYILSSTWVPFSEVVPSYFGVLDPESGTYKKLIDGMVIRAAVKEEKGYLFADDKLVEVDLGTGEIRIVSSLPLTPSYSYDYLHVNCIIENKMYFTLMTTFLNKEYCVDLKTGNISEMQ